MGVITYGDTSGSTYVVKDRGYIVTSFNPNSWGGNTDPQSGRQLYVVYNQQVRAERYDTSGDERINVICSRSVGGTDKANVFAGTLTSSFATYSANTNYLVGDNTTYYAGLRATSDSGARIHRASSTGQTIYLKSDFSSSPTTVSGAQWLRLSFYGLPDQVEGLSATSDGPSSIDLSWDAASAPDTEGTPTKYRVEYKKATSSTWELFSSPNGTSITVTGLEANTEYNFRVGAQNGISNFSGFSDATGSWSTTATATTGSAVDPPTWSGSFLSGQVGESYDDSAAAARSTSITLVFGSIPDGLTGEFESGKYVIDGTPTEAGSYFFTLRASNDGGDTDQTFSIYISPQSVPQWTDQTIQTLATEGESYSDGVSASGADSYSYIGDLPLGMSFNTSNGKLTADQLLAPGLYNFTIFANNEAGSTQRSFTIIVETAVVGGAKRIDENGDPIKLTTYKRFNGSEWVELTIAKRFDGTSWQDI